MTTFTKSGKPKRSIESSARKTLANARTRRNSRTSLSRRAPLKVGIMAIASIQ